MLDKYFKQYFWTFNLLILAVCAYLVARAGNTFVGYALSTQGMGAIVDMAPVETEPAVKAVPASADSLLERNVFKAEREDIVPEAKQPEAEAEAQKAAQGELNLANCKPAGGKMQLVATIAVELEENSVAVFVDPSKKRPESYRIGDELDGMTVAAVTRGEVLVDDGGTCKSYNLDEDSKKKKPRSAPVASKKKDEVEFGKGVRQVTDNEYEIPRSEIDGVLGNLNMIATQARIVPSFRNGKSNGFKLFSIRPNSLYAKIGIQNGDVVQKINGYEMNSPDKALEVYSKLKDASEITVDLVRRGKAQTLSYSIR